MPTINQQHGKAWSMFHGDCVSVVKDFPDESIDCVLYSPPFSSLYIYSDSENDMGNCKSDAEFFEHYKFLLPELLRVTVTGRLCLVHCKDLPKYANRDGTTGLIDFPGMLIRAHEECGWSYHSRVTIWKCPVIERERTNNNGLLYKTALRDRSQLRMGMADYLLAFRKPPIGTLMSDKPVTEDLRAGRSRSEEKRLAIQRGEEIPENHAGFVRYIGDVDPCDQSQHPSPFCRKTKSSDPSIDIWRRYAEPVWWDVNQTRVLNKKTRDGKRHICPLQLDVIERAVQIWTNPGDRVLSPFAGYGSELWGAIKLGRRGVGIELNEEYFQKAVENLTALEKEPEQAATLLDGIANEAADDADYVAA
jgi:DNA modification methylase